MVFQRSLISFWQPDRQKLVVGVPSEDVAILVNRMLESGSRYVQQTRHQEANDDAPQHDPVAGGLAPGESEPSEISWVVDQDLAQQVKDEKVDLAVLLGKDGAELIYRDGSPLSIQALRHFESRLQAANEADLRMRLRSAGKPSRLAFRATRRAIVVATADTTLSTLVPMILILMTVTGAVYPAIDLTAGERERGTLEMLMAAPVPRLKLLLAKYVAVVAVACLTAMVNLLAMTVTLQATGLGAVLFGDAGLSPVRVVQILALLVLFAAFFSAVLLALTSFARSFKEAQAYLIPLMLLSLGPGIVSLLPGLQLRGLLAITPVSNMVLLARDLCGAGANPLMATVVILSTALYTLAAIAVAARIFGADAVLSSGATEWSALFSGERQNGVSSVQGAFFCLAVLFPVYFLAANGLGQLRDVSLGFRLVASGVASSLLFGAIPWMAARLQRLDIRRAFQWHAASPLAFVVASVLGSTLWPLAHEIFLLNQSMGLVTIGPGQRDAVRRLLEDFSGVSPIWILLSMALAPAVFEELFFRGYLFSALRAVASRRTTVFVSAVLFGLFHVVSTSALSVERFLPSTFLGFMLGWLCYQSRSVLPGMVLHACHNGILLLIAYYRDPLQKRLQAYGWNVEEQSHLPVSWIVSSLVCLIVGGLLIASLSRARPTTPAVN